MRKEKTATVTKPVTHYKIKNQFLLFISYSFGSHYNAGYSTLRMLCDVVKEMGVGMELPSKEIRNAVRDIKQAFKDGNEDIWIEFSGSTWITVTFPVTEEVTVIRNPEL